MVNTKKVRHIMRIMGISYKFVGSDLAILNQNLNISMNVINRDSVHSSFRKGTKKGAFPNENALLKVLYFRVTELQSKWDGGHIRNCPLWFLTSLWLMTNLLVVLNTTLHISLNSYFFTNLHTFLDKPNFHSNIDFFNDLAFE